MIIPKVKKAEKNMEDILFKIRPWNEKKFFRSYIRSCNILSNRNLFHTIYHFLVFSEQFNGLIKNKHPKITNNIHMKILVIGGGNMGLTYALSFLNSQVVAPKDMMILEKSSDRVQELNKLKIGKIFNKFEDCIPLADLIILAVKPQDSTDLFQNIRRNGRSDQIFLSIM